MRKVFAMVGLAMLLALSTVSAQQKTDFGRMFPDLPAFQPADQLLVALALAMLDLNAAVNDNPLELHRALRTSASSSTMI